MKDCLNKLNYNEEIMLLAFSHAKSAFHDNEVPIGCVIVNYQQEIVSYGHNLTNYYCNPIKHAEIIAIEYYFNKFNSFDALNECALYVTVEPCIMCSKILSLIKVGKIFFGCWNPRFGGCGSVLKCNNLIFEGGYLKEIAIVILRRFYLEENKNSSNPKDKSIRKLKTDDLLNDNQRKWEIIEWLEKKIN